MEFLKTLGMIEDYVGFARDAIAAESEGNFKYYVGRIEDLATDLRERVERM